MNKKKQVIEIIKKLSFSYKCLETKWTYILEFSKIRGYFWWSMRY